MSKEKFYSVEARKLSGEVDYGVWWRNGRTYPTYRVSFVVDTGELYATDQHEQIIILLGKIEGGEQAAEKQLKGWAEECGKINSLEWIKERVS